MRVIFARPAARFDSYSDFWRLAWLSGFPCVPAMAMNPAADVVYVTTPFSGEQAAALATWPAHRAPGRTARVVWWSLERPDGGQWPPEGNNATNMVDHVVRFVDAVWTSDRAAPDRDPRLVYAPLGGHAGLTDAGSDAMENYDYAHMSYVTPRRAPVHAELLRRGFRPAPNAWGPRRSSLLRVSRLVLNIHQTPAPVAEPLRFALAAAHGIAVVSETIDEPWPLRTGEDYIEAPIGALPDLVSDCLRNPVRLARVARSLRSRLCSEYTFRAGVEDALDRTFGRGGSA